MTTITVFGATGQTGRAAAEELLEAGARVRVAVRDARKVEDLRRRGADVIEADVLDVASLRAALAGADGAYLLIPPDPTSERYLARGAAITDNIAAALRDAAVGHVAFLSSVAAHLDRGTGPIVTVHRAEEVLREVPGVRFSFLRAGYFMENLLGYLPSMRSDGVLPVFGGGEDRRFPMVATRDVGRAAAAALLEPPSATAIVEVAGPAEISFDEVAAAASRVLGREVRAQAIPLEAMVPALTGLGLSADLARLYQEMAEGIAAGRIACDGSGRRVRGVLTIEDFLRAHA